MKVMQILRLNLCSIKLSKCSCHTPHLLCRNIFFFKRRTMCINHKIQSSKSSAVKKIYNIPAPRIAN